MNIKLPENLRLTKLPAHVELVLYLIKSELKGSKLMDKLQDIGVEDESIFSYDLSTLILNLIGFTDRTDELYEWYSGLLEKYALRITPDDTEKALQEQAFNFFLDLEFERRVRSSTIH